MSCRRPAGGRGVSWLASPPVVQPQVDKSLFKEGASFSRRSSIWIGRSLEGPTGSCDPKCHFLGNLSRWWIWIGRAGSVTMVSVGWMLKNKNHLPTPEILIQQPYMAQKSAALPVWAAPLTEDPVNPKINIRAEG